MTVTAVAYVNGKVRSVLGAAAGDRCWRRGRRDEAMLAASDETTGGPTEDIKKPAGARGGAKPVSSADARLTMVPRQHTLVMGLRLLVARKKRPVHQPSHARARNIGHRYGGGWRFKSGGRQPWNARVQGRDRGVVC